MTLHIIGNGFDRSHKLPTSYQDFKNFIDEIGFLSENKIILEEAFNQNGISLWSDFERCIGNIDLTTYADKVYDDYEETSLPEYLSINVYNWFRQQFSTSVEELMKIFKIWVWQLEYSLDDIPKNGELYDIGFDFKGYFLSFNYTNTLEEIYGVPKDHIYHLHGNANDEMSKIIVGHNTNFDMYERSIEGTLGFKACVSASDVAKFLVSLMNEYKKPFKEVIRRGNEYLKELEFDNIIVMGCSFNDIDMPYFDWLAKKYPLAQWILGYHTDQDLQNAIKMDFIDVANIRYIKI